jgi:hypothetical protein
MAVHARPFRGQRSAGRVPESHSPAAAAMARTTQSSSAEPTSMELEESATDAGALPDRDAAAAAALAILGASAAAATADAGQSVACMAACPPLPTDVAHIATCACALRSLLCRCPTCLYLSDAASGLGRQASLRALSHSTDELQGQAAQA